jgi:4-hydroxyproline epimerase
LAFERVHVVDTHTGGEPTRVVFETPFELQTPTMLERRDEFRSQFDQYRKAIVCEPRGSDVMVGALVTPPVNSNSVAGVIFFNNVGYLGMCGHGTIGLAVALQHREQIKPGRHLLDTPVGTVAFELSQGGRVTLQNVPSYRYRTRVPIELDGNTIIHGDIAWGGNWLFICEDHGLRVHPSNVEALSAFARRLRKHLDENAITGENGAVIDHVDLIGPPSSQDVADARNFVLCPGGEYDRSPCGTGTSAKLACLAADGKLKEGEIFRQESIVGSVFDCSFKACEDGSIIPSITGSAFVNAQADLLLDPADPFRMGL